MAIQNTSHDFGSRCISAPRTATAVLLGVYAAIYVLVHAVSLPNAAIADAPHRTMAPSAAATAPILPARVGGSPARDSFDQRSEWVDSSRECALAIDSACKFN